MKGKKGFGVLIKNKKAYFDYSIIDEFEAGIKLTGAEAKALREGRGNLRGSYVNVVSDEVFVLGFKIRKYSKAGGDNLDEERTRKLLLGKNEVKKLIGTLGRRGLSAVPLKVYTKGKFIKMKIGIVMGRKKHEKKEILKRRDMDRDLERELKAKL